MKLKKRWKNENTSNEKKNINFRSRRYNHQKYRDANVKQIKLKTATSLKYENNREMKPGLTNF